MYLIYNLFPYKKSFKVTEKVSQGIRIKRIFPVEIMKWILNQRLNLQKKKEKKKKDFLEVDSKHETEVSIWIKIVTVVAKGLALFEL